MRLGTTEPSVTVVIAAFNAAGFIGRAIESALAQGPHVAEVLVVDDASTDATVDTVLAIAAREPRVRVLQQPVNGGPSAARNAGLDAATGEWVAVLDADDAYLPGRLEALLATAQETGADVVLDNFWFYDVAVGQPMRAGLSLEPPFEEVTASTYLTQTTAFGKEADWGLLKPMFRLAFLDRHGLRYPLKSRHGEDFLLMADILLTGAKVVLNRQPFYLYTSRDSGMSRTTIDYELMSRHSKALLEDPRIAADKGLRALVQQRVENVKRLAAERRLTAAIMARNVPQIAIASLASPWALRALFSRVERRLSGLVRN